MLRVLAAGALALFAFQVAAHAGTDTTSAAPATTAPSPAVASTGSARKMVKDPVRAMIRTHAAEVSACREAALPGAPAADGKVVVEMVIGTAGSVTTVRVTRDTMKSPAVQKCLLTLIRTWVFPRRDVPLTMVYPFFFGSPGDADKGPTPGEKIGTSSGAVDGFDPYAEPSGGDAVGLGAPSVARGPRLHPVVVPGKVVVKGSLPKAIITRVVRSRLNQIRFCYEKELMKTPGLTGMIELRFVINGEGRVVTAGPTRATLSSFVVVACVAERVRTWSFPKPEGGDVVEVRYPFKFLPKPKAKKKKATKKGKTAIGSGASSP